MTTAKTGRGAARRRPAGAKWKTWATAAAFIAPAFIGLAALYLGPLIGTISTSFTETGPFGGGTFIGLENYRELLSDGDFWAALRNSAVYSAIVLLGIPIAVVVATLIHTVSRGRSVYRVLYFLPVVTLPVAIGMVWRFIYNGEFGILNVVLSWFGIEGQRWVADPDVAIYAVAVVGIWMGVGTNVIIIGAGLRGISRELYEASALDGAGRVQQFFRITLPLLTPSIFFVSVLTMIAALQMFDLIYVMIGRGSTALDGSKTIVYYFYEKSFEQFDRGYGAAIAVALLLIIMAATAVQFRLQKRWVFYG